MTSSRIIPRRSLDPKTKAVKARSLEDERIRDSPALRRKADGIPGPRRARSRGEGRRPAPRWRGESTTKESGDGRPSIGQVTIACGLRRDHVRGDRCQERWFPVVIELD